LKQRNVASPSVPVATIFRISSRSELASLVVQHLCARFEIVKEAPARFYLSEWLSTYVMLWHEEERYATSQWGATNITARFVFLLVSSLRLSTLRNVIQDERECYATWQPSFRFWVLGIASYSLWELTSNSHVSIHLPQTWWLCFICSV
jgi:hypothetical protein